MTTLVSSVRSVLLSAPEVGPHQLLRRDATLFFQGQDANAMFFIDAGLVKLTRTSANGSRQILSVLGSHQLAGEECLLGDAGPYRSDAECLTDVTVYSVPVATVMRLFGIPDFAAALVSYAVRRDFDYIQKVELLARYDVEHRILHGLAELACLVTPTSDGAYQIPMIQAEIASFVGATRETTSTTLSVLQTRRLVTLSRRLVTTVHPGILISAANDRLTRSRAATG